MKFVSVESGIGWIPFFLESLDYQLYESAPSVVDELSMLPSEYFQRQVYGCFWFEHRMLEPVIDALGATQVLFETDFPHPTCLYPDPLTSAADALAGARRRREARCAPGQRRGAVSRRAPDSGLGNTPPASTYPAGGAVVGGAVVASASDGRKGKRVRLEQLLGAIGLVVVDVHRSRQGIVLVS